MSKLPAKLAIDYLGQHVERHYRRNEIVAAIMEWTRDAFTYEAMATVDDVVRHLQTTSCASCHAPSGLIYNHDIAAKVPAWWDDINEALDQYKDAYGNNWTPGDGESLTVGAMVWFAVEWFAGELASALEGADDLGNLGTADDDAGADMGEGE